MPSSWLSQVPLDPGIRVNLVCLPHAGGGAAMFHKWKRLLPDQIAAVPIQLPGRENRLSDTPVEFLEQSVRAIAEEIVQSPMPRIAIFGHSMGALIGYELCQLLSREYEQPPILLIATGCRAPHLPVCRPEVHLMPDDELISTLNSRYGGFSTNALEQAELLKCMLPAIRADMTLVETYQYQDQDPLSVPILALGGTSDHAVSLVDLAAWRQHTNSDLTQRQFPGGHFFIESAREAVLKTVVRRLDSLICEQ
ncbi:MAG: alpha/beta fold hydrolase [Gammaproteobacteria bacterium]|nr:alpha/beta fold hydrolase [Gammaproteobacteria bacterium]